MIVAVTPSKVSYLEACNTLNYAERAVQMKPEANKNVLNANGHISVYSALIEDYKEEVEGLQITCEKAETENTAPETEVGELNNGLALMKASRNALLRAQETGAKKIYRGREKITGQIWDNKTVFGTSVAKEYCEQLAVKIIKDHVCRLATTVRRTCAVLPPGNLGGSFEGFTTNRVFIRFPNWSRHPHQHRRSGSSDVVVASATPMAPS
ncbi:hypothetical protein HPB49_005946 [Dermacentor silvarum]|uniref:Uncharacterized protein n=1 Tax=Dermacentor silvarum TaxID=543639 RepID=A0ACB8DWB5_DERSI|nr:hypothetical protein HPB49_005946 [Dermacentor silvarum]